MTRLSHAGVGWPNGAVSNEALASLPTDSFLMLATEGRYHFDWLKQHRPDARILWRAIPRIGKRPAELGWSPSRFVAETINLTDEPELPITDFIPWNELDLQDERGDREDDWSHLDRRYALIGGWALSVVQSLKQWSPGTRIHWGAWTPDHDAFNYFTSWSLAAEACDVVDFHAYDSLANIERQYHNYRLAFPAKPLALTEWHCKGDVEEERRVLQWLAETMAVDPLFEAAYFFIWRWHGAPGWWSDAWDVEHNPERLALFRDPPVATEPEPERPVYRVPAWTPAYEHIRDGAIQVADEFGMPRRRLLGLCLGEAGFGLQSFDRWASIERSKRMVAAINARDWSRAEAIFAEIAGSATNDISFGPAHQSWWWSLTDDEQQAHPEWRHDLTRIMEFRAHLIEDHGAALRLAAGALVRLAARHGENDQTLLERYNKPNAEVSASVRENYRRSLAEADRILAEMQPAPPPSPGEPSMTVYEQYPDPFPAGILSRCDGVILHASRSTSTTNTLMQEYTGTANYEISNPRGLGWNATIGPGRVAVHMGVGQWGHNARDASNHYVAVEIAQPYEDYDVPKVMELAIPTADYIFDHVWPVWGELWHFPSHAELEAWGETGFRDGKTDLYHTGDGRMNEFRQKVYDRLNQRKAGIPTPVPTTDVDYASLTGLAYNEDGVVVPALSAALANPDDVNLRMQADAVLRWLRSNRPPAA